MVDVFVAKMHWGGQIFSISLKIFCFKGTLSITACKSKKLFQMAFKETVNMEIHPNVIEQ
jgi:hypothetical protein